MNELNEGSRKYQQWAADIKTLVLSRLVKLVEKCVALSHRPSPSL